MTRFVAPNKQNPLFEIEGAERGVWMRDGGEIDTIRSGDQGSEFLARCGEGRQSRLDAHATLRSHRIPGGHGATSIQYLRVTQAGGYIVVERVSHASVLRRLRDARGEEADHAWLDKREMLDDLGHRPPLR